jgi:hypothetical protein
MDEKMMVFNAGCLRKGCAHQPASHEALIHETTSDVGSQLVSKHSPTMPQLPTWTTIIPIIVIILLFGAHQQ